MSEAAAIIGAVVTALTPAGVGIAWLWRRVELGFKDVRGELRKCQEREIASSKVTAKQLIVIELLWQAASKSKAAAPVLARCKQHLDELNETTKELVEK